MAFLTVLNHYKHVNGRRLFWQRGTFLRHPISGAEALITVDGEQNVCMETRGSWKEALLYDLKTTLEKLIYDKWPGTLNDEEPPFTFTVPCPTPDCKGKYAFNVLQAEQREGGRDEAFCDGRRAHRHPVATLLHGIQLPTAFAEMQKHELSGRTYGAPPRLLEISEPLDGPAPDRLTKDRRQIQLCCELSGKPVPGATGVIEADKELWERARKSVSFALKVPVGDFKNLPTPGGRKLDPNQEYFLKLSEGRSERLDGQILPSEVASKLIAIANKGEMRQTQLSDGRWVWASKEEADRNDPTIPKER
jgi:hypothetical protein